MRTNWETYPVEFTGGLITSMSPLQQGINFPGSATILQNFEPSIEGGYKKITGYQKWSSFPVPGTGQIQGAIITGERDVIVVRDGKYYTSVDKADWVERLDLSSTAGNKIRWDRFNFDGTDKIVMVDGVNKPVFWDSSDQSITEDTGASSDVEGATRVIAFKNHLFFSKGSLLLFTAPFDETDYNSATGAGVINVGARITALAVFREQLIVFSVDRINRVVGNTSDDFEMQPITTKTGAMCGDTVQEVGGDILYLGPDGVRYLSATERIGDFALERASKNIQKEITEVFADCGNYASTIIRRKNQYRLFRFDEALEPKFQTNFLATRFIDREAEGIAWATIKGMKVYSSDSWQTRGNEQIVFVSDTDYVYSMEEGNSFDGEHIECVFRSPFMPIVDPRVRKTFYRNTTFLKVTGELYLEARLILDYGQEGVIQPRSYIVSQLQDPVDFYGVGIFGVATYGGTIRSEYPNMVIGSGFNVAIEFREESSNPSFSLDTTLLEYRQNDRK